MFRRADCTEEASEGKELRKLPVRRRLSTFRRSVKRIDRYVLDREQYPAEGCSEQRACCRKEREYGSDPQGCKFGAQERKYIGSPGGHDCRACGENLSPLWRSLGVEHGCDGFGCGRGRYFCGTFCRSAGSGGGQSGRADLVSGFRTRLHAGDRRLGSGRAVYGRRPLRRGFRPVHQDFHDAACAHRADLRNHVRPP